MLFLSRQDLIELTSTPALIAAVEQGLRDFAAGQVVVPVRQHLDLGESTLLTMPVASRSGFGAKIVSVVPANANRALPVINGIMTLSDAQTGMPVAVLDAAVLTARRTGAVGAVALKCITPEDVESLGVVGSGVQGVWQTIFACQVRRFRKVHFLARSDEKARQYVEQVSSSVPSVSLHRCRDAQELLARAQVVITATTAHSPVLPDDPALLSGKHYLSVGSFKPSMQELPDAVYRLARQVVVDSHAARTEVGDVIAPLAKGCLTPDDVIHLADVVAGKRTVHGAATTVCKSVGMALYDLYVAQAFLAEARRRKRGAVFEW